MILMSQPTPSLLDPTRNLVRLVLRQFAKFLNGISKGKLTPNMVTITGLLAHIPIAWLIAAQHNIIAAILLIFFGLFDTLDGELSRLQKTESTKGMLLDAVTDRYKEVILYTGVGYSFVSQGHPYLAVWAIVACGASLSVSYVKAKGESAYLSMGNKIDKVNNLFKDGLMRFEIRMVILILGLLTNRLSIAIIFIAVMSSYTAIKRLITVSNKLDV
jgi:CDP-diacylglycerol--glycerol-3-phosphate 3-phosphatidyltransferase